MGPYFSNQPFIFALRSQVRHKDGREVRSKVCLPRGFAMDIYRGNDPVDIERNTKARLQPVLDKLSEKASATYQLAKGRMFAIAHRKGLAPVCRIPLRVKRSRRPRSRQIGNGL
jgi:hypothetical protein